jgi:hypothetical protein
MTEFNRKSHFCCFLDFLINGLVRQIDIYINGDGSIGEESKTILIYSRRFYMLFLLFS